MSDLELVAELEQDLMMDIIKLQSEGRTKSHIQQKTGASYKKQAELSDRFKVFVNSDRYIQERARESVGQIDIHYTSLLTKFYEVVDEAESADDYKTKADVLKKIADVEKQRVEFLAKAGMMSAGGIGDDLVELEEQREKIKQILREIATERPDVAQLISQKLAKLDGTVVAERVVSNN